MFYLILFACLLVGFGDARNVLTPLGYWLAWGAWAVCSVFSLTACGKFRLSDFSVLFPKFVFYVFFVLVFGMVLSAIAVPQYLAFYQSLKIFVISIFFGILFVLVCNVSINRILSAISITLFAIAAFFILFKYQGFPFWIRLGDGREGFFISYPGVMWKSAVFFLPLLIADVFVDEKKSIINGVCVGLALYLLVLDGSRTGFLFVVFIFIVSFVFSLFDCRFRSRFFNLKFLIPIFSSFSIFFLVNNFFLSDENKKIPSQIQTVLGGASEGVLAKVEPLALERLTAGDSDRISLFVHGWKHAIECFPFGCGFETTSSLSHGITMPVHNAYLAVFGDFGLFGLVGLLGFLVVSAWPLVTIFISRKDQVDEGLRERNAYIIGASAGSLAFCGSWMLHTFSSEMSEWGFLILFLALSWSLSRKNVVD